MKKITYIFLGLVLMLGSCKKDDATTTPTPTAVVTFLAPTTPMKKSAVLEDFTGVRCQFCTDDHVIAKTLETTYPGKIVVIAMHTG